MKIKTVLSKTAFLFVLAVLMSSCLKDNVQIERTYYTDAEYATIQNSGLNLPRDLVSYEVELPRHLKNMGVQEPRISNSKATLGRVLFYDQKLSKNESVSCASCHDQELAFSDKVRFSEGFDGELTPRNSLALASTVNFTSSYDGSVGSFGGAAQFFWDERAGSIEEQSRLTIEDNIEMGMDLDQLAVRLNQVDHYQILFRKAYGDETVTKDRIVNALSEFVNSFVSVNSKFDEGMAQHGNPHFDFFNFTDSENRGRQLFNERCSGCHSADHSSLRIPTANNGLDLSYEDNGIGALTGFDFDDGRFKVPFLRNIALTGPYMHDGRFATLEEVIDHYSTGIKNHQNLDFQLRNPSNFEEAIKMNFSEQEKADLVAFLHTLTDDVFTQEEKFSDPFQ